jgi:dTDP-4-amino-4,6-dideoxygalactose transaminase
MSGINKRVPFLDLGTEFRGLEAEWLQAIHASGEAGTFILGPQVSALEREIAAYVGVGHAVAVANGTDSLVLSLRALDIGPGDEVITTPFTFFATTEAITVVGATPVFADILPDCYTLDPASVRALISKRTRAVLPVHLYGHPARMDDIQQIAREHRLAVIEDCAQAFGAKVGGKRVGSMGDAGSFSFYPTKVLGCYGDGGMITTNSADLAERLRRLRNHGAVQPFIHTEIGYNSRLDEIQAALLRIKLRAIDEAIAGRRAVAAEYDRRLAGLPLTPPTEPKAHGHVFNLYTLRSDRRDALRTALSAHEVASNVCYPVPLHLQKVYEELGYRAGSLPVAEKAAREVLSLPIYPGMPATDIARVCEVVRAAL